MLRSLRLLFAACLLVLGAVLTAQAAEVPQTGVVSVREADGSVIALPAPYLAPYYHYRVQLRLYRLPPDTPAGLPHSPLPARAEAVAEVSLALLPQLAANSSSMTYNQAARAEADEQSLLRLEPTIHYDMLVYAYGPEAERDSIHDPAGPLDAPIQRCLQAAQHISIGGCELLVYCPAAMRYEVEVERGLVVNRLEWDAEQQLPRLVRAGEPPYEALGWASGSFACLDLGPLFMDGEQAPPPDTGGGAELLPTTQA